MITQDIMKNIIVNIFLLFFGFMIIIVFLFLILEIKFFFTKGTIYESYKKTNELYETHKSIPINLCDRMKYYEELTTQLKVIPPEYPFIVRIDGRFLNKIIKKNKKINCEKNDSLPYSLECKRAMLHTANNLLHEFQPATVYTHSNEITLIFSAQKNQHIFGGKVLKIISIISSFASVSFERNLLNECLDVSKIGKSVDKQSLEEIIKSKNNKSLISFDGKILVFPLDKTYEIANHMIWRSKGDCTRNFIAMYAEKYIGKKEIQCMCISDRIEKLKELKYDLSEESSDVDYAMKHGVFLKLNNNKTIFYVFRNLKYSTDMMKFLETNEVPDNICDIKYDNTNYGILFNL